MSVKCKMLLLDPALLLGNAEDVRQMPSIHIIKTNKAIAVKSFTVQKLYKPSYYLL